MRHFVTKTVTHMSGVSIATDIRRDEDFGAFIVCAIVFDLFQFTWLLSMNDPFIANRCFETVV